MVDRGGRPPKSDGWRTWLDLDRLADVTSRRPKGWKARAECGGMTSLFYPDGTRGVNEVRADQAKGICAGCPVVYECLADGIRIHAPTMDSGIWGRTTAQERREIRSAQRAVRIKQGVRAGA